MKTTLQGMLAQTYDEDRVRAYEKPRRVEPSKARPATPRTGIRRTLTQWILEPLRRRTSVAPFVTTVEPIAARAEGASPAKS